MSQAADLVVTHGKLTTLAEPGHPAEASAVAIRGGRIVGVGDAAWAATHVGPSTVTVDAGGRRVLPGLIDAHTHYVRAGVTWNDEVHWNGVGRLRDALTMVADAAAEQPGRWVCVMGGWHPTQFEEQRHPTREDLDSAAPDTPVLVQFLYEWGLLNRAALDLIDLEAGVRSGEIDPETVERDAAGRPTGRVRSLPSLKWVFGNVPRPSGDEQYRSTISAAEELSRFGVTGLIDGGGANMGPDSYAAVQAVARDGLLPLKVRATVHSAQRGREESEFAAYFDGARPPDVDPFRVLGGGEILLWSIHDAFTRYPTLDETQRRRLLDLVEQLAGNQWTVHMHLMRPETTLFALEVMEEVAASTPMAGLRWAIVHGYSVGMEHVERLERLGVGVIGEALLRLEGDEVAGTGGFPEVLDGPPLLGLAAADIPVAIGSDAYRVSSHNPYETLRWFTTGRTLSGRQTWSDDQLVDRETALRWMTHAAAWFSFEESERGRLQEGFAGDLTVCTEDPLRVPDEEVSAIRSALTVVDGEVVWADGSCSTQEEPATT